MRLALIAPVALGLVLVGCGREEPAPATPPAPTTQQPTSGVNAPPREPQVQQPAGQPAGPGSQSTMNPPIDDNGSGTGTASGAGTTQTPGGTGGTPERQ